ncbi:MAG: hypothetical protein V1816_26280 [Pseudomonadota bacterium]
MAIARGNIVREGEKGVFHVTAKCVRGAYLGGTDPSSGKSYEHRRAWILSRLKRLTEGFGVKILAYAFMPDHFHLAAWTRPDLLAACSGPDLARRWLLVSLKKPQEQISEQFDEQDVDALAGRPEWVTEARERLGSLSWFMRCFNEYIARRANKEDGYRGRFWDGRFKCQSILDDSALLTCMAFIDLNPIRSGLAGSLEDSAPAAIALRLAAAQNDSGAGDWLYPFHDQVPAGGGGDALPFNFKDYHELLEWTGGKIRAGEAGVVPENLLPLLNGLEIDPGLWLEIVRGFSRMFFLAAGKAESMKLAAQQSNRKWLRGYKSGSRAFL